MRRKMLESGDGGETRVGLSHRQSGRPVRIPPGGLLGLRVLLIGPAYARTSQPRKTIISSTFCCSSTTIIINHIQREERTRARIRWSRPNYQELHHHRGQHVLFRSMGTANAIAVDCNGTPPSCTGSYLAAISEVGDTSSKEG
jgi:hypothetical protein